jgi:hypothetical protein
VEGRVIRATLSALHDDREGGGCCSNPTGTLNDDKKDRSSLTTDETRRDETSEGDIHYYCLPDACQDRVVPWPAARGAAIASLEPRVSERAPRVSQCHHGLGRLLVLLHHRALRAMQLGDTPSLCQLA